MRNAIQIGEYLIRQLYERGVRHVFGVPGDFILRFFDMLAQSDLRTINTCDEQGAGFAADAYARLQGLGVVCVTYGVGGLKVVNTTAQAFAEESPVVVISGAPGLHERQIHPLLHHKARDFDSQKRVFEQVTVASAVLDNTHTAMGEIDRVLATAERYKRPVYIEIPRDMVAAPCEHHHSAPLPAEESDPETLQAALDEACSLVRRAKQPVILGGVELHRFGLQDALLELVGRTGIPVATTLLGKSVIGESSPFYIGLYQGQMCRAEVRDYVESSDCVLLLGVMLTDLDLGVYTARLQRSRCIHAVREKLAIGYHTYEGVRLEDFIRGLAASDLRGTAAVESSIPVIWNAPSPTSTSGR